MSVNNIGYLTMDTPDTEIPRSKTRANPTNPPKILSMEEFIKYKENKVFMYVKDLKHTIKHLGLDKNLKGKKKPMLEDMLFEFFTKFNSVNKNKEKIEQITKIQALYRARKIRKYINIYGVGILDKNICNNREDFYTFEPVNEIEKDYFFSYKDQDGFVYGFDIRSFKKLLDTKSSNPYNREEIPNYALESFENRVKYMIKNKVSIMDFVAEEFTPEQQLKNKVMEVFQKIDELDTIAGGTNINWFLGLNFNDLKNYYKLLEDIWNYRANLTQAAKMKIVPQNDMFQTSMNHILNLSPSKEKKLRIYILNEIDKLVSSTDDISQRTTGAYYVLTAFAEMVPDCAQSLPWLVQDGFQ
jgi:hypothetical protein